MYSICKIQPHTVPSLQGTLAKHAKPTLLPNFVKEPFNLSRSNAEQSNSATKINRLNNKLKNGQFVACDHTQYRIIQKRWIISAYLYLDTEVASKFCTVNIAVR